MTYQQLFDDLIGETPLSTVDVDRVIGRQRRARRLRIGAGTTAVAAAVALVVFGTTGLIGRRHAAPAPATTRSPAPTIDTVPGTPADAARIRTAVKAAVEREVPGLVWLRRWGGKDSAEPVWMNLGRPGPRDRDSYSLQAATFRVDRQAAQIYVQIERDGGALWEKRAPCPTRGVAAENCAVTSGGQGERVRARRDVTDFGPRWDRPRDQPAPGFVRKVEVLRPDGFLVTVRTVGLPDRLTPAVLTRIAADRAITLSGRPPASPEQQRGARGEVPIEVGETDAGTALGSALIDVSPGGRIYFWSRTGSATATPTMYGMGFVIDSGELAGDGEAVVERWSGELSCARLADVRGEAHREHSHDGECTESTRPDGNRQLTIVSRRAGTVTYIVFVHRPGGTLTEVRLDNRPTKEPGRTPSTAWAYGLKPGGATPPLTLEQVAELAAHPDLLGLLP